MASKGRPRPVLLADQEASGSSRNYYDDDSHELGQHLSIAPGTRWNLLVAGILLLVVAVTYVNSFQSGWVLDNLYIIRSDPRMQATQWASVGDRPGVKEIFSQDYWWPKGISGLYRPVTTFTYWMNYTLFDSKENTTGFHWVNLLLHWANAVLIYFVGLRLLQQFWLAFFAAGLFATHPIATESVTNIIGRADQFAAIVVLGGLLIHMRLANTIGWRRIPWLMALMLLLTFGLFAKESSIALVGVLVAYDLVYHWKIPSQDWLNDFMSALWRFFLRVYVVLIPPILMMWAVRKWVFENATPPEEPFLDNPIRGATFIQGRLTAIKVIGKLLWRLVWPQSLSADYSYNEVPLVFAPGSPAFENLKAIFALIIVVGLIAFAFYNWKRNKGLAFWIFFFFIALMPTANLIIVIGSIMAERFIYLPLAGFVMATVVVINWALHKFIIDRRDPRPTGEGSILTFLPHAVFCIIMVAFGVRAAYRNLDWRSDATLFTAGVKECPNAFRNYQSLAFALYTEDQRGNIDRIVPIAEKGLSILDELPKELNSSRLYLHLGMYYITKATTLGKVQNNAVMVTPEAAEWLQKATKVMERGKIMDRSFNEMNRNKELKRGKRLEMIPDAGLPQLYQFLGDAYRSLGVLDKSAENYSYARRLDPRDVDTYGKLAELYSQMGKQDLALQKMTQMLVLRPNQPMVWNAISGILNRDGAQRVIVDAKGAPLFNSNDMMVKEIILDADREFVRFLIETHRPALAQSAREVAVKQHGFAPTLIDPLFVGTGVAPTTAPSASNPLNP